MYICIYMYMMENVLLTCLYVRVKEGQAGNSGQEQNFLFERETECIFPVLCF